MRAERPALLARGAWAGRPWRVAFALPHVLLLSACVAETSGSPDPPPEFGPVAGALFGCADVQGVYAWPPVAGEYAGRIATNREPWAGGRPVPIGRGAAQVWVSRDATRRITVRARDVVRDSRVPDRMAREWSYVEYARGDYSCDGGAVVVAPDDIVTGEDYGGTGIRRGFHLVALADGALAVGIRTVAYGRSASLFSWGGQGYGSYDLPDKTYWTWSKLARTGDGDREPEPFRPSAP